MTHKRHFRSAVGLLSFFVAIFALSLPASAEWKEKVLYSFQGIPDGSYPAGGVVFDQAGNLYGATTDGGANNCPGIAQCGTVFQLQPPVQNGGAWTENVLYVFKGVNSNDGNTPVGGVIFDQAGNLYGTTAYGGTGNCMLFGGRVGCGTVYEMVPPKQKGGAWTEMVLHSFRSGKDGYFPWGDLTFDSEGNLYGATQYGGGYGSCNAPYYQFCGTVFKLSPPKAKGGKWTEVVLHSFEGGSDGANPNGGLVLDKAQGNVYGTTFYGGNEAGECDGGSGGTGCGTVFALLLPKNGGVWTEKVLYRFNGPDGATPAAGVIFGANGDLFGTAYAGAIRGNGAVFDLAAPKAGEELWKETLIYRFSSNTPGANPEASLTFDTLGNMYGTTFVGSGNNLLGSVFRLTPPKKKEGAWILDSLHGFLGPPDGDFPAASLVFDKHGDLYGTTQAGGTGTGCRGGCGTVFKVSP
jgi:hypothetical protein